MKVKQPLYLVIAVAMLLSLAAMRAMAEEDPIPMWVSRVRLAYNGRSSSAPDRVVGMVHVRDADRAAVEGAAVLAEWTLPDGTVYQETAPTTFQGIARFKAWSGKGMYKLCVVNVTKEGWLYDSSLNRQTCTTLMAR